MHDSSSSLLLWCLGTVFRGGCRSILRCKIWSCSRLQLSLQVWSLTQFYYVDCSLSQWRIGKKKCVFYKHTIKVCVSCSLQCPGTSASCVAHLTVSLYLCSYGSNARVEGPWRVPCKLKKPFKGSWRRQWSCLEKRKRKLFPRQGVIDQCRQLKEAE